jgi:hypothetical protein
MTLPKMIAAVIQNPDDATTAHFQAITFRKRIIEKRTFHLRAVGADLSLTMLPALFIHISHPSVPFEKSDIHCPRDLNIFLFRHISIKNNAIWWIGDNNLFYCLFSR